VHVTCTVIILSAVKGRRRSYAASQSYDSCEPATSVRLTGSFWQVTRFASMTDDERVMWCRCSSRSLIRIAVAKREDDDDDDDELRIRYRFAINWQNPPPIYRQIGLELTTLLTPRPTNERWGGSNTSRAYHRWYLSNTTVDYVSLVRYPRTRTQLQNMHANVRCIAMCSIDCRAIVSLNK